MANPCSSRYAFFADEKNKGELLRLHKKLSDIMGVTPEAQNNYDPGCLSIVAIAHGLDCEKLPCRGSIDKLGEIETERNFFTLESETDWTPMEKLWEAVIALYSGVSFFYIAEEAGADIFVNTDIEGVYIPEKYLLEIWGDIPIPEEWYTDQKKPDCLDIREHFNNLDDFTKYCANFTGEEYSTFEEWKHYFHNFFERVGNVIVGVHEFTAG
jgi:hypothetical protein